MQWESYSSSHLFEARHVIFLKEIQQMIGVCVCAICNVINTSRLLMMCHDVYIRHCKAVKDDDEEEDKRG